MQQIQKSIYWVKGHFNRLVRWVRNPNTWLKPKSLTVLLILGVVGPFALGGGIKFTELWMEDSWNKKSLSLEYGLIAPLTKGELDEFSRTNNFSHFNQNLDDELFQNYFVLPLTIKNTGRHLIENVCLEVDLGCQYAKIIDVREVIYFPKGKKIALRTSLPNTKWQCPSNQFAIVQLGMDGDYDSRIRFNIYCSIATNKGFGKVNPSPVDMNQMLLYLSHGREPNRWFTKVSHATECIINPSMILSSEFSGVMEIPNQTFSAPNFEDGSISEADSSPPKILKPKQNAFLRGQASIYFESGLDHHADVRLYILGKVLPGERIFPSVRVDGSPEIELEYVNNPPQYYLDRPALDSSKIELMPEVVRAIPSYDKVVIIWDRPANSNYAGAMIYRSPLRAIGNFEQVGDLVFTGYGGTNTLNFDYNPQSSASDLLNESKGDITRFFPNPPDSPSLPRKQPPPPPATNQLSPPKGLRLLFGDTFEGGLHFVDSPPQRNVAVTYTFYPFDEKGHFGYPTLVNVRLDDSATNCSFRVVP